VPHTRCMPRPSDDQHIRLSLSGRNVAMALRPSRRAKRIILRIDPVGAVTLVVPRRTSRDEAVAFARSKAEWLNDRLASLPAPVPFADGTELPLLGRPHRIRHAPGSHGVRLGRGEIVVAGEDSHLPRRVADFLRREARRECGERARRFARRLGLNIARVSIRDPKSRWGSCSHKGHLSFSWRLILAPEWVLDYVIAHEVAHLVEMNHGPRFWRLVEKLYPESVRPRDWLRRHGTRLHRYG
jgi:predicted metal-dependent hydrolase